MSVQIGIVIGDPEHPHIEPEPPEFRRYKVQIPEWDEIIHIVPPSMLPEEEQIARKRQQVQRIKASPVPEIVQQIGRIMNIIDDAEDLISTMLLLGRPILRRLGSRVVPYLGWILTAVDIAELAMALGTFAGTGMLAKRNTVDMVSRLSLKRGVRLKRVEHFMRMRPGFGALLEGLQALDTVAGVGISLGPIMGLVQDNIWGLLRYAAGQPVTWDVSPHMKAEALSAKVLMDGAFTLSFGWLLPPPIQLMLLAAHEMAWDHFRETFHIDEIWDWLTQRKDTTYPRWKVRNPISQYVMHAEGVSPEIMWPPLPPWEFDPSCDMAGTAMIDWQRVAWEGFRNAFGHTAHGTFTAMGMIENTESIFSWFENEENNAVFSPNMGDAIMMHWIENGMQLQRRLFPAPLA